MAFLFCITVFVSIMDNYSYPEPETPALRCRYARRYQRLRIHAWLNCVKRLKNTAFILNMFLSFIKTVFLIFSLG